MIRHYKIKNKQTKNPKTTLSREKTRSDRFCQWPFLCHHVFMCEISKCHINSWLLTFYSITPFYSLPLSPLSSTPSQFPLAHCGAPCPVLWQAFQAGVWLHHVQRWEAASSGCRASELWRVSAGVSLSGWLQVYRRMDATVSSSTCYPWPRFSQEEHTHENSPLAWLTLFTVKAAFGSAVEFATIHP